MEERPTGGEDAAAQLRAELDQLRADVADLQSLRADVDSLKTMIASLHEARQQDLSRPTGPKKLTIRGAATKIQIGAILQAPSQRNSAAMRFAPSLPTASAGEGLEEAAGHPNKWNRAKAKIPVIGRLALSARMKRLRTQVHHSVAVDGADPVSALDAGRAAAAERVSIVDIGQDENLVQSDHTSSPVGKASMSAAQPDPGRLHVEGNPAHCEGGDSQVGKESSGLHMIDEDDHDANAQEDRKARNTPSSEVYPPPPGLLSERSGHAFQPPFLPPAHTHHKPGSTNQMGRVHRNSHRPRSPSVASSMLEKQAGTHISELATPNSEEDDSMDEEDGADDGERRRGSVLVVDRKNLKKKQSVWQEDDSWVKHTQNAYGAFAHVAMQSGILRAMQMCGPMLMASIMIQTVFAAQLLNNHWNDMV